MKRRNLFARALGALGIGVRARVLPASVPETVGEWTTEHGYCVKLVQERIAQLNANLAKNYGDIWDDRIASDYHREDGHKVVGHTGVDHIYESWEARN